MKADNKVVPVYKTVYVLVESIVVRGQAEYILFDEDTLRLVLGTST